MKIALGVLITICLSFAAWTGTSVVDHESRLSKSETKEDFIIDSLNKLHIKVDKVLAK